MEKENDIVKDAYYLVSLFNKEEKNVTQLHIQKLMFLFEAYYMVVTGASKLYDCEFQAWNFGPVAIPLYKVFKKYGRDNIVLNENEVEEGNSISDEKKKILKKLYEAFNGFTAIQLVTFTHAEGSPWKEAWKEKEYSNISKESMKNWFSQYVQKR